MKLRKALVGLVIAGASLTAWAGTADAATRTHHSRHHRRHHYSYAGYYGGIGLHSDKLALVRSGGCDWLDPYLASAGLPVSTFKAISARESGCSRTGVRVANRTDLSTSRFGLNFRGSMPRFWASACGTSDWQAPGRSVAVDVRCTAAAFHRSGLRPWR